jgi:hypothetical protein
LPIPGGEEPPIPDPIRLAALSDADYAADSLANLHPARGDRKGLDGT